MSEKRALLQLYRPELSLLTDLYQLTMAHGYWQNGDYDREAIFHLFYRKNPFKGDCAIACGLDTVIDYLQSWQFHREDIQYLGSLKGNDGRPLFDESFLNYLQRMRFECDIEAVPEGTLVFPHQPLIKVRGPLIQAQLIETALLNMVNYATLIATKAARIVQAADGDTVLEFGLRRAQGIDGGLTASRAAYVGGCHATSNVLAGKLLGIPVRGTHAHSWVMAFSNELEAFRAYARAMPNNCVFLVDTFDTIDGVRNAISVARELRSEGHKFLGVRLDSGDLAELSIAARQLLDEAGFPEAQIIASNDLDEYRIQQLKERGATIKVWGVGTRLVTAYDQPALGGVYKLGAVKGPEGDWHYKIKLSEDPIKVSNPGSLQVLRRFEQGQPVEDLMINSLEESLEPEAGQQPLLQKIFTKGQLVYPRPDLHQIRRYSLQQQEQFAQLNIKAYPCNLSAPLKARKNQLIEAQQFQNQ
ncbi:MAG: nicotinate phosphoribosyltransferase [Bacteroidota bacterium]